MLTNNVIYKISLAAAGGALLGGCATSVDKKLKLNHIEGVKPRNVVFILSDDHRYDYMGFLETISWLETPCMDRMAREGAYIQNAFVTTSLGRSSLTKRSFLLL